MALTCAKEHLFNMQSGKVAGSTHQELWQEDSDLPW